MAQTIVAVDGARLANGATGKAAARGARDEGGGKRPSMAPPKAAPKPKPKKSASRGLAFERRFTQRGADPLDAGHLGAAHERHHEPRRLGRLQDGGRRDPRRLVAARDRHRRLQVLPQGRPPRRQGAGRDAACARSCTASRTPSARRASSFGGYFATQGDADTFEAELSLPARQPVRRVQLAGVVQLRPLPRVRHRRARAATGRGTRQPRPTRSSRRRTPTSARSARRASSRRSSDDLMSIYDLVKSEARLFKYGSGTGTNFSAIRGQQEKLSGGGTSLGPDELPRGVRSRRGRDQERRHHAARGQDGLPRHGPPRDRRLHQLEGARGEEGARAHRRGLLDRLQRRGLPHGQRAELEQLGPRHRRLHARGRRPAASGRRIVRTTGEVVDTLRARRTSGARSPRPRGRCADPGVQYDTTINRWHTCPNTGPHQRVEPVLRVHVPRRHGLQPVVAEPHQVPARGRLVRRRRLPPRVPRLLPRAGDPGRLLELPDRAHRARTRTTTARSASATRTSARCSCCWASRTTRDEGRAIAGALTAIMCGHAYAASAPRWRRRKGAVRRLREEPRADARA